MTGVSGASAARRIELSSDRWGGWGWASWVGAWLFRVGLVRHEMSIRPLSGGDGLQVACPVHVGRGR